MLWKRIPSAILKNVFSELFNTISLFIPYIITFVVRYLITYQEANGP